MITDCYFIIFNSHTVIMKKKIIISIIIGFIFFIQNLGYAQEEYIPTCEDTPDSYYCVVWTHKRILPVKFRTADNWYVDLSKSHVTKGWWDLNRIAYDWWNYMIVSLNGTLYHYCGVSKSDYKYFKLFNELPDSEFDARSVYINKINYSLEHLSIDDAYSRYLELLWNNEIEYIRPWDGPYQYYMRKFKENYDCREIWNIPEYNISYWDLFVQWLWF